MLAPPRGRDLAGEDSMRIVRAALAAGLLLASRGALGAGSIDTTGASLTAGAGSPQGVVVVDAAAPAAIVPVIPSVPPIDPLGDLPFVLPPFAGAGTGADGAFVGSGTVNAAGGTLTRVGDLAGVPADGRVDLDFVAGAFEATGAFRVRNGRFASARAAGKLIAPAFYPRRIAGKLTGVGRDTLTAQFGFAVGGVAPESLGDVIVQFAKVSVLLPADAFRRRGEKFVFAGNVDGVTALSFDFATGAVVLAGKGLDLGALPGGANVMTVRIVTDDAEFVATFAPVRVVSRLAY
jgi:hypothetical protein